MDIINKYAPLKLLNNNNKRKNLPWFDRELFVERRLCDKLYSKFKKFNNFCDKEVFIDQRNYYQKLLRLKKIKYYTDKTASDFKNSKKFWEFYQSSVKIKSDKSGVQLPD